MSIRAQANRIGTDRSGDVLEGLLAQVSELDANLTLNLIVSRRRDAGATGLRDAFEPSRDIDAITKNVITLDQDVTEVNPDPEQHPAISGHPFVPLVHRGLHCYRAFDCIDYRGKLKQHAVTRGLDETTSVFCHESEGNLAVFAECAGGADLISTHQARVARDISRQDRR